MSTDFKTPPTYVSTKNHFAFFKLLYAGTWTDGAKLTGIFLKLFTVDVSNTSRTTEVLVSEPFG
jgi:hypothetical protein